MFLYSNVCKWIIWLHLLSVYSRDNKQRISDMGGRLRAQVIEPVRALRRSEKDESEAVRALRHSKMMNLTVGFPYQ